MLDKLRKRIFRTVDPSLAASLEPLAHRRNVASLSNLYRHYFGICLFELALNWFHFVIIEEGQLVILINCIIFSVTIPRCYKDVYVNSSLPYTARLWNSFPKECFPLTYDLNGFKSRINRHLLYVGSF